jgi:hypothetical protein
MEKTIYPASQTQPNSSVNVTANHFSDHIDSTFISMVRALAIEFSIKIDPDAKELGRNTIQDKMNSIIPSEAKELIKKFSLRTEEAIKRGYAIENSAEFIKLAYQVLKIMRIDNVS